MTDLLTTLPSFPTAPYTHLIPSLERSLITTTDLLTLDALEVAKRAQLPPLDVKRLIAHVSASLRAELGVGGGGGGGGQNVVGGGGGGGGKRFEDVPGRGEAGWGKLRRSGEEMMMIGKGKGKGLDKISVGDGALDAVLAGGIPTGCITEIVGESGAGKTQLLLSLLLLAQLSPSSGGLASPTIYISTEHPLPTARLAQILASHPSITSLPASSPHHPSLAKVLSIQVPDLESQDHILTYQLPVALARHGIRLVVIDSIAANYRAEKSGVVVEGGDEPSSIASSSSNAGGGGGGGGDTRRRQAAALASRSALLIKLGGLLRSLAREHDCAVVVANQVSDRFTSTTTNPSFPAAAAANNSHTTPPPSSTTISTPTSNNNNNNNNNNNPTPTTTAVLSLDHQLRFFSGWGAGPPSSSAADHGLKTPALGLTWANQIAGRIVLVKAAAWVTIPAAAVAAAVEEGGRRSEAAGPDKDSSASRHRSWRRWMGVAFAAWCAPSGGGAGGGGGGGWGREFEVWEGGVRGV